MYNAVIINWIIEDFPRQVKTDNKIPYVNITIYN